MKSVVSITVFALLLSIAIIAPATETAVPKGIETVPEKDVPPKKRTKQGLYLTAKEAYQMWRADPLKTILLDVRIPAEYVFVGHPPMAYNVPYEFWRSDVLSKDGTVVMKINPKFIEHVKKVASPDETLLVMCRSGKRSAKACDALAKAGYKKVFNIVDGFEGDAVKDRRSSSYAKRTKNGWRNSRMPWTYELRRNLMYLPKDKK